MIKCLTLSLQINKTLNYSECISTPGELEKYAPHGGNRTDDLWNTSPML